MHIGVVGVQALALLVAGVAVVVLEWEDRHFFISLCARLMYFAIAGRLSTCLPIAFQIFLFCASSCISEYVRYLGKSIKSPPSEPLVNCATVASFTSLASSSLSRWPSQTNRRDRIAFVRSYVLVVLLASTCASFPVNLLISLAFAPLIFAKVWTSRSHASHPYVSSEHIAVL